MNTELLDGPSSWDPQGIADYKVIALAYVAELAKEESAQNVKDALARAGIPRRREASRPSK